jgi:hypothetical protein
MTWYILLGLNLLAGDLGQPPVCALGAGTVNNLQLVKITANTLATALFGRLGINNLELISVYQLVRIRKLTNSFYPRKNQPSALCNRRLRTFRTSLTSLRYGNFHDS